MLLKQLPLISKCNSPPRKVKASCGRHTIQALPPTLPTGLLIASICTGLTTASGALDADAAGYQQLQQQQVLEATRESPQTSKQDSSSWRWTSPSRPFDSALSAVIDLADTLNSSLGEFLDLTEAAQAAELSEGDTTYSVAAAASEAGTLRQWQAHSGSRTGAAVRLGLAGASSGADARQNSAALPEAATSARQEAYLGVASRMAMQARAVAGEAVKLAMLLDSQQEINIDPSYQTLLQQIAEAAGAVSSVAADIAQPGEWIVEEGLDSSSSNNSTNNNSSSMNGAAGPN